MHGLFNGVLCHSSIRLAASWFAHSLVRSPSCEQSSWRHSLKREIEGRQGAFPHATELEIIKPARAKAQKKQIQKNKNKNKFEARGRGVFSFHQ